MRMRGKSVVITNVYELVTPWSVKEELTTHRNPAVAMVVAAFIVGMAIVIAAAIL